MLRKLIERYRAKSLRKKIKRALTQGIPDTDCVVINLQKPEQALLLSEADHLVFAVPIKGLQSLDVTSRKQCAHVVELLGAGYGTSPLATYLLILDNMLYRSLRSDHV